MFIGYATDHASDTYKMLNLRTKHIWQLRNIKWITNSIEQLKRICAQDAKPHGNKDDEDDAVEKYVQATRVNLIPANDNEDDNTPAADDQEDEGEEANVNDDDGINDEEGVQPATAEPPATHNKTLRTMHQLSTFYNPIATSYFDDRSENSDNTEMTSNQSGREAATNISDETKGDLDGDLYQDHPVASAAIDYLPNFAFYTCNQVLIPSDSEVKTLDYESAFEHHLIEPTTFDEAYNHEDPKQQTKWHVAIKKEFRDMTNQGVWHKVKRSIIPKGH